MSDVRRVRLLGMALFALILAACGGNDPHATTQTFADALVEEDYTTAASYWAAESDAEVLDPADLQEIESFLVEFRASLIADHGSLNGATVQEPTFDTATDPPTQGTIPIVWQLERADVMTPWFLAEEDDGWRVAWIPFLSGMAVGELTDDGVFVTPTPAPPTPTPQPTSRNLTVGVAGLPMEVENLLGVSVTVVESDLTQALDGTGTTVFRDLPLGTYTLQLTIPGREPTETTVAIQGDQPPPDRLDLPMGDLLASDPATMVLHYVPAFFGTGNTPYTLSRRTEAGLEDHWTRDIRTLGPWNADRTAIHVATRQGVGWLDTSGIITWDWQPREPVPRDWVVRPDFAEIAYIANNDVWTVAADATATPVRWTEVGIAREVQGWMDPETLLVITENGRQIVRRDGTQYAITAAPSSAMRDDRIRDRVGWVRFLRDEGTLLQPGADDLLPVATIPEGIDYIYGWTRDNQYLLIHSDATAVSATSGVLAIASDGTMQTLAPDLILSQRGAGRSAERLMASISGAAMGGNRWVLAWQGDGQEGIYRMDSADGTSEQISAMVPEQLFLPTPDLVLYTIGDGSDIGTWAMSADGGNPTRLFAYQAEQATAMADGTILLVANDTFWETDGQSEPVMLGTEGTVTEAPRFFYHLTADERAATSPRGELPTAPAPTPANEDPDAADTATIEADIQAFLNPDGDADGITFELQQISDDGQYVRGQVTAPDTDPAWVFLRRDGDTWENLGIGTLFPPETLAELGIPEELWMLAP